MDAGVLFQVLKYAEEMEKMKTRTPVDGPTLMNLWLCAAVDAARPQSLMMKFFAQGRQRSFGKRA